MLFFKCNLDVKALGFKAVCMCFSEARCLHVFMVWVVINVGFSQSLTPSSGTTSVQIRRR